MADVGLAEFVFGNNFTLLRTLNSSNLYFWDNVAILQINWRFGAKLEVLARNPSDWNSLKILEFSDKLELIWVKRESEFQWTQFQKKWGKEEIRVTVTKVHIFCWHRLRSKSRTSRYSRKWLEEWRDKRKSMRSGKEGPRWGSRSPNTDTVNNVNMDQADCEQLWPNPCDRAWIKT